MRTLPKTSYNVSCPNSQNAVNAVNWNADIQFRYSEDVDHLTIYFRQATEGLIVESEPIDDDIIVDLDKEHKVVSIEFCRMGTVLGLHALDDMGTSVSDRSPIAISSIFSAKEDSLTVLFTFNETHTSLREKPVTDYMSLLVDDMEKVAGVLFSRASSIFSGELLK